MESVLKSQLKNLKSFQKFSPALPKNTEATFLFDFHNSKKVDIDTIYELGYSGLIELSRFDNNFIKYFNSLFNNTSKYFNRNVKKEDELKPLDQTINQLLYELNPYFRHKSSHRVIEYLIKIYQVHIYNSKNLLLSFLPYHETKYFIKLIQNINFENNYVFFHPYVKNGTVVLKDNLFKELGSDFNLLMEVINFYDELTDNISDNSVYFRFISEIFEFLIKSSTKNVDVNLLTLILRFLNKTFKFFSAKCNIQNEEYEENIINNISELVIITVERINLNSEYSKAILNDIISKLLPFVKSQNSTESLFNTLLIICENLKVNNKDISVFKEESLKILENYLENIKSSELDIFPFICLVFNSVPTNTFFIKKLLKLCSQQVVEKFIQFLLDYYSNLSEKKKEILEILAFIDQTLHKSLNNVLINIFSSKNDKTYIEKLKNITKEISEFYSKAFKVDNDNNDVNAFNIFINLNSTNISLVIESIKMLDDLIIENLNEVSNSVTSISNKFSFLDNEIVISEVLNMKCFKILITNFPEFKNNFLEFYFNLNNKLNKLYSEELIKRIEENVVKFCFLENEEMKSKILIYFLFFSKENDESILLSKSDYFNNIFKSDTMKINQNIVDYICNDFNGIKFFRDLNEVLLEINHQEINIEKIISYVNLILLKNQENINIIYEYETIINILSIPNLQVDLFDNLASILIENFKFKKTNEIFKITQEFSFILVNKNSFSLLNKLLDTLFNEKSSSIQIYLSHLLISRDILHKSYLIDVLNYIKTKSFDTLETSLFITLLNGLLLGLNNNCTNQIFSILTNSKNIGTENFNFILSGVSIKNKNNKSFVHLKEEIIKMKYEILINKNYIKKYISSKIDNDVFFALNEIFVYNMPFLHENIDSVIKLLTIISPELIKSNQNENYKEELLLFYNTLIEQFLPEKYNNITNESFFKLLEILLVCYLKIFPNCSEDILHLLLLDHQNKLNLNEKGNFINRLFSQQNLKLDMNDLDLNYKILKFAFKYSISPDSFILNDTNFNLKILDYIYENKLHTKEDEHFIIYYIFEIIFRSYNTSFNLNFVASTLKLIDNLADLEINNSFYLNLANNLLTVMSNCTVDEEERSKLKIIINRIEKNIFKLIEKFKSSGLDTSSLEIVQIVNTMFLCLNKLILQFTNINEEKQLVKIIITNCFRLLNEDSSIQLTEQVKEEIYIIFINAIRNFIELLFLSHSHILIKNSDYYDIFYEYIHHFVKFSMEINFKNKKTIEQIFENFQKNEIIKNNPKFLACFFVNLFYYNFIKSNHSNNYKECYSDMIFTFFTSSSDNKLNLDIILCIISQLNSEIIFFISLQQNISPCLITLNLLNKILNLVENGFYKIQENNNSIPTLLEICTNIYKCKKNISNKMIENNLAEYPFILKEILNFEEKLFRDMNETNLLDYIILLIYQSEYSKQTRNYLLTKYLDILILDSERSLEKVFEFFIGDVLTNVKEKNIENLQIIFAILTKILSNNKLQNANKTLKKSLSMLQSMVDLSNEKIRNINYLIYQLSILVFLSKIFYIFGKFFLDNLNILMEQFLLIFDLIIELKIEEVSTRNSIVTMTLETFNCLSNKLGEFLGFHQKQIVLKLLILINQYEKNDIIKNLINSILKNISNKQILDVSMKTVKVCVKNLNVFSNETPLISLMSFFSISISQSDKIVIAGLYTKILKIFIKLLLNENVNSKMEIQSILNCFQSFILKVNEKQLKIIFADLIKFAKEPGDRENDFKYNLPHSIVTIQLFNTILKSINMIFVPYFEKYKTYWTDLVTYCCAIFSTTDKRDTGKKKNRQSYDLAYDENNKFSYLNLNTLLLENVRLNFKYNTENQLLNETVEDLIDPMINEFKLIFFDEEKLMIYFDSHIKVTFVEIFNNINSDDLFKEFNDSILNLIREDHYIIKLLTLKMIKSFFEELKERYAMFVTDIIPYVTDCIEDSNEKVNIDAFNLMKFIEKTTGEDFKNYMDLDEDQ